MSSIHFTRMAGLALAFGFFFFSSCTVPSQTLDPAEEELRSGDFLSALESVNRLLDDEPGNEDALLLKVRVLAELAQAQGSPHYRTEFYNDMRVTLDELPVNLNPQRSAVRDSLINMSWGTEQDASVRLLRLAENRDQDPDYDTVISHLDNALVINPDSSVTWNMKVTTYYMQGDISNAIETLEEAAGILEPMPVELRERLAFLYLEEGSIESSVDMYEALYEENPESDTIVHGLINAYILNNDHSMSVSLLREHLERGEEGIIYREALATELYFLINMEAESLLNQIDVTTGLDARFDELFLLIDEARTLFTEILEIHPNPDEIMITAATFYKNSAQALFVLSGETEGDRATLLRERSNRMLEESIPLWESIADTNPENPEYWRHLYQVYTQLGMDDEAESARTRGNL